MMCTSATAVANVLTALLLFFYQPEEEKLSRQMALYPLAAFQPHVHLNDVRQNTTVAHF